MHRDGHIVQIGHKGTRKVKKRLIALAPGNALDATDVQAAILIEGGFVTRIMLCLLYTSDAADE